MRRTIRRVFALVTLALVAVVWPTAAASAHPLGNFTVNLYSGLHVVPGEIRIDYVVDMAEIPTFQEMASIDADGDGATTSAELAAWTPGTLRSRSSSRISTTWFLPRRRSRLRRSGSPT